MPADPPVAWVADDLGLVLTGELKLTGVLYEGWVSLWVPTIMSGSLDTWVMVLLGDCTGGLPGLKTVESKPPKVSPTPVTTECWISGRPPFKAVLLPL